MLKIGGILIVFICLIWGYLHSGGRLAAFWQPGEIVIILGCGIGTLVLANAGTVLKQILAQLKEVMRKSRYNAEYSQQLLMLMYELLDSVQNGGLRSLDNHIENPTDSELFQRYPLIASDTELCTFIADNFRMMAMGKINEHELEGLLEQELNSVEENLLQASRSLQRMGEAMPGFGICAAVLGIVITMQSIDGSIAIVGVKVAAALIGTFLGVFICYCLIDPLANAMEQLVKKKMTSFECLRTIMVNQVAGKPPLLAVDAGRKMLPVDSKPSFTQLENWVDTRQDAQAA
ncbi:flagellar motor stator protein MotA [Rosenbergiella nectarea]|uniref:flagellar motor stator protein MotA n=1 Tax=Rosenbergiella nectarea TaxID=988801 RepID=UPI001BDAC9B2|nr:flagellar motor stator protein MotA [Rosenbergiella nectarea]MBT0730486.1 flagellar motor stator protein MotA [Rosenbergiella nectarea subsp. apis]